ncbi:DNA polymerase I [Enterococcus hirae]|nr:DNA polymerase I [Enterococcus hirae]
MKNKLLLIDGNSVAYRAFFAMHQSLERFMNGNGLHTNAIYAFNTMLDNILTKEKPTHGLVAFDAGKTTFRNALFEEYKAGRAKTPPEFREQLPYIRELVNDFGLKTYELPDYEADDIIGTLSKAAPADWEVVVVSGDKDLTQLASDNITVQVTIKGVSELEAYTPKHIAEKYDGLTPTQIIDMKGLAGDNSDNIPGVQSVGPKTAIKLLNRFQTVEGVYQHLGEIKQSKMKDNLMRDKDQALLSKKLATIDLHAPVTIKLEDLNYEGKNLDELVALYQELDFKNFLSKLNLPQVDTKKQEAIEFKTVDTFDAAQFAEADTLYIEMLEDNYHIGKVVGAAWGSPTKIYATDNLALFQNEAFKAWLENGNGALKLFDAKRQQVILHREGIALAGVAFDVLLGAYLLDTNDNSNDIANIASYYDLHDISTDEEVYGKGAKMAVPEDRNVFLEHLSRKVKTIQQLTPLLEKDLRAKDQWKLFKEIELPLSKVLGEMEIAGIKVDPATLEKMRGEFKARLKEIEKKIYQDAGHEFNLNSPKQLGIVLFEEMGLPVIKKTKTGYSTAVDVLEKLKVQAPIVQDILDYRQLAKLQSTYVEGLLKMILADGRVHTRYLQTLTQTGRLSSVDPNLQNIPIRTAEGRMIRQAFVPREADWLIYSSDYSQIELRVLAHISGDEHLREAFMEGQDIHTSTAMRIFGIKDPKDVTPDMRRHAKTVNFGIVYGISDYGLSQRLNISRQQAQQYIDTYFEKYPGVKRYMEDIVRVAKDQGYVETLFHRRRYLKDINSRNFNLRSFAERTAINTPIQGSAADIIKIAMIRMQDALKKRKMQATMLLQVHDELIFEHPESELKELDTLVKDVMEHSVELDVPLITDSNWGKTWYEAK